MLRLFEKPKLEPKEYKESLEKKIKELEAAIIKRREQLKYLESPENEQANILVAKEQELRDKQDAMENLIDKLGERELKVRQKEKELAFKEAYIKEKEYKLLTKL